MTPAQRSEPAEAAAGCSLPSEWLLRSGVLPLDRPLVMGVLNVTPDSFSDGGLFADPHAALEHAAALAAEGADLLDIGGESTRPGAEPVPAAEERRRVLPVLRLLKQHLDLPLSVDTRKAEVAAAALDEGAEVINDVSALADPQMGAVVARAGAALVLMHMRGEPRTMQADPHYDSVVDEVRHHLAAAREKAIGAGVAAGRIALDPGIGFGKTTEHNLLLLRHLGQLAALGAPLLVGVSRKAFLGTVLGGKPAAERGQATAAACVAAYLNGANIFRVHDVGLVREALEVAARIRTAA